MWSPGIIVVFVFTAAISAAATSSVEKQLMEIRAEMKALRSSCQPPPAVVRPNFGSAGMNFTFQKGQGRDTPKNATKPYPDDMTMNGWVNVHQQNGNLFSMMIHVDNAEHDAYEFLCTFTDLEPNVAHCSLTFEEPHVPEGPAWVRAVFDTSSRSGGSGYAIPSRVSVTGTYFYWMGKGDAGVYSFEALNESSKADGNQL